MPWLLWRELTVMTRTRAIWPAMIVQGLALTLLIVSWGDGVPVLSGSFFEQFMTVHWGLLLVILPWVAARLVRRHPRDVVLVASTAATTVRAVVLAQWLALMLALMAITFSAAPFAMIAARVTNAASLDLSRSLLETLALCAFVAASTTTVMLSGANRLLVWSGATLITIVVVGNVPRMALAPGLVGGAALALGLSLYFGERVEPFSGFTAAHADLARHGRSD
jgi:hypothetical protein